jgi:hypothetical protein
MITFYEKGASYILLIILGAFVSIVGFFTLFQITLIGAAILIGGCFLLLKPRKAAQLYEGKLFLNLGLHNTRGHLDLSFVNQVYAKSFFWASDGIGSLDCVIFTFDEKLSNEVLVKNSLLLNGLSKRDSEWIDKSDCAVWAPPHMNCSLDNFIEEINNIKERGQSVDCGLTGC